ncbi:MAG: GAF domain-containing protein, partial [Myxococcota bacterium]
IREAFRGLLETGTPYDLVLRIVTARGRRRWVRAIGQADRVNGKTTRAFGAFQDITVLHEKDAALQASERRYQELFHSMVSGFALHRIVTDDQGEPIDYEWVEVNDAFERLTGLSRDKVIGKRASELIPTIHESEVGWVQRYGRVALEGEPEHFEAFEPTLARWYEVLAYRPEPRHFVTLFSDVTERKLQEHQLADSQRLLQAQRRLAEAFLSAPNPTLFNELLAVMLDVTGSKIGYVGFINENGDLVSPSLTRDVWDRCQVPDKSIVFPKESWAGLWGRSLRENATLWSNDGLSPPLGHLPLHAALAAPIRFDGGLIGQAVVANKTGGYADQDAKVLEELTGYIGPFLKQRIESGLEDLMP